MRAPLRISCGCLTFLLVVAAAISLAVLPGQMAPAVADPQPPDVTSCPMEPLPAAATECPPSCPTESSVSAATECPPSCPTESSSTEADCLPSCPTESSASAATECPQTSSTRPPPTSSIEPSPTPTTPEVAPAISTKPRQTSVPTVPVSDDSTGGGVLAALLLLLCALLLGGLLTLARRQRGVAWVKAHVTVAPRSGPAATFDTCPSDELNRDHVFAVVPVEVQRSTTIEENH
jgi:hypothetical protein